MSDSFSFQISSETERRIQILEAEVDNLWKMIEALQAEILRLNNPGMEFKIKMKNEIKQ